MALTGNAVKRPLTFSRILFASFAFVLVGYMLLGKFFAYIGAGPFRIGEMLLLLGFVYLVFSPTKRTVFRNTFWIPFFMWVIWSCMMTLPYIPTYGIYALRDGVTWGYALFALISAKLLINNEYMLAKFFEKYAQISVVVLILAPVIFVTSELFRVQLLGVFGSAGQLMKAGDIMVHMAGISALMAFGLIPARTFNLVFLTATVFIVATRSRGGLLAYLTSIMALNFMSPWYFLKGTKILSKIFVLGGVVAFVVLASGQTIRFQGGREVSPAQIVENVVSIFSDADSDSNIGGTKKWRVGLWSDIVNYTIFGDYFWAGRGYGINLATVSGFQVISETSNRELVRSPHNIHMTILARSGVIGLFFWIWLNISWVWQIFMSNRYARYLRDSKSIAYSAFLFVMWVAMQVNASFDVYLEGPMGGIWFWTIMGIGIAHTHNVRMRASRAIVDKKTIAKGS